MFKLFDKYRHNDIGESFIFLGCDTDSDDDAIIMWGLESKCIKEFDMGDEHMFFRLGSSTDQEIQSIRKFINERAMDVFKEMESSYTSQLVTLQHETDMIKRYSRLHGFKLETGQDNIKNILGMSRDIKDLLYTFYW